MIELRVPKQALHELDVIALLNQPSRERSRPLWLVALCSPAAR